MSPSNPYPSVLTCETGQQAAAAARDNSARLAELQAEKEAAIEALHKITVDYVEPVSGKLYKDLYLNATKRVAELEEQLKDAGSMTSSSEALEEGRARIQELEDLLDAERGRNSGLDVSMLADMESALAQMEREAAERAKAHEAALKAAAERLRPALEAALARIKELEETLESLEQPVHLLPHVLVTTGPGSPYLHPVPMEPRPGMIVGPPVHPGSPLLRSNSPSQSSRSASLRTSICSSPPPASALPPRVVGAV